MRSTSFTLTIPLVAAAAACSSNSASPGQDAGGISPAGDAGGGSDAGALSTEAGTAEAGAGGAVVAGQVVDASMATPATNFDATQYSGLPGVQVCLYGQGSAPCVTTDASGKYTLAAPAETAFTVSYTKTGYQSVLYAMGAQAPGVTDAAGAILMTSTSSTSSFEAMAGITPDPTQGLILFGAGTLAASPGALYHEMFGPYDYYYSPGYSVTISPAATVGPVYVSAAWEPDPSLMVASNAGWGVFQAPPGTYTLTFSSPTLDCTTPTTTATVVAGYATTYVGATCTSVAASDASVSDGSADAGSE